VCESSTYVCMCHACVCVHVYTYVHGVFLHVLHGPIKKTSYVYLAVFLA